MAALPGVGLLVKGWRERVAADAGFPFVVLVEQTIGVSLAVTGDALGRGDKWKEELDFIFSTLVVGSIVNFALVWLMAARVASPAGGAAAAAAAAGAGGGWAALKATFPPGHLFQSGNYTAAQRAGTFVVRGYEFAAVGLAAGLFGTWLSNTLVEGRKKRDPTFVANASPPPLLNASAWALHMGFSANARYQALNGMDLVLAKVLPGPAMKLTQTALRTGNNVLGGIGFVLIAKAIGAQK